MFCVLRLGADGRGRATATVNRGERWYSSGAVS